MSESRKALSTRIASITAYLIGVQEEMFNREFKTSVFEELQMNTSARTIRTLCIIRNQLMRFYGTFNSRMRAELVNLDSMPDYFDPALFVYLRTQGISLIKANAKPMQYLIRLNQLINERINACQTVYPMWVKWEYVHRLFQMPKGGNEKEIRSILNAFHDSLNSYPYHCYINWPINNPKAYQEKSDGTDTTTGNILQNDRRFLVLLYRIHQDEFTDFKYIMDIGDAVQNDLIAFLTQARQIVLAVDCENSDPYKLCAVLDGLREAALRGEATGKIAKIILYDDVHTVDAWDILQDYVSVPIEHIQTERVNEHKSLVDVQLTVGVTRSHYAEGVDSFLLASSDSDFWGLIKSLPSARFMVLLEKDKYGEYLTETLERNGVGYCIMDDFAGNTENIKRAALDHSINTRLSELIDVELDAMLEEMYGSLRITMTDKEKANYREKMLKALTVDVSREGVMKVSIHR